MSRSLPVFVSTIYLMLCNVAFCGDKAKVTIKAVEEDGKPASGIEVDAKFLYGTAKIGATDTNGLFVLEGDAGGWDTWYSLQKGGYYRSDGKIMLQKPVDGKWQPWNPIVTVVMRRVICPISMYAKRVNAEIPVLDQFVGYDLMRGDWVAPYGKGEASDFNCKMQKRFKDIKNFDSSLELIMTNAVDGIKEVALSAIPDSAYRLPRMAPLDGYERSFYLAASATNRLGSRDDQSFLFQVRSVTNTEGKIVSALYGKIRGRIGFGVSRHPTGVVLFTYYLNPTPNDRNLEFDPRMNLLHNLKSTEEVTEP